MNEDGFDALSDQQLFTVIESARTVLEQRMKGNRVDEKTARELLDLVTGVQADLSRVNQSVEQLRGKLLALVGDDGGGSGDDPGPDGDPDAGPDESPEAEASTDEEPAPDIDGQADADLADDTDPHSDAQIHPDPPLASAVDLAFPGAEGFGARSQGGRGGQAIAVTNLDDDGPGSLREALTQTGPRIVVFETSGTISLQSPIRVSGADRSYLTIAGQSAPGQGIQIVGLGIVFSDGVHDVVVRNIRIRMGGVSTEDTSACAMGSQASGENDAVYNIIFDHCSFYWGYHETGLTWNHCHNITWQWCIFEGATHRFPGSAAPSSARALLVGADSPDGERSTNISIHHCLMANSARHSPGLFGDGPFHVINNVIYNWQDFATQMGNRGNGARINLIGNHYKRGPASNTRRYGVGIFGPEVQPDGLIYVRDNIGPYRTFNTLDDWDIVGNANAGVASGFLVQPAPKSLQKTTPWPDPPVPVTVMPVESVVEQVLESVGALPRDQVDERVVNDYHHGTGSIKHTESLAVTDLTPPPAVLADADREEPTEVIEITPDGELDYSDPSDRNELAPSGYTRIEEYLNELMAQRGA